MIFMKAWLLLILMAPCLSFARLGETMAECDARYGQQGNERPPRFPGSKARRVYAAEVFRIDIEFNEEGKAWVLLFRQAQDYRLQELRDKDVWRKAEQDGRYGNNNDLWKDEAPFEKIDWAAANYKDTEGVGNAAKAKAAERDGYAIRAAENIHRAHDFFRTFFPGSALQYATNKKEPGMAGMIYDIFQANAGAAEWRSNGSLQPIVPPQDRASSYHTTMTSEGTAFSGHMMGSLSAGYFHRSDRQAFACQTEGAVYFWSRAADNALIAYAVQRAKEIDSWSKQKGSKF